MKSVPRTAQRGVTGTRRPPTVLGVTPDRAPRRCAAALATALLAALLVPTAAQAADPAPVDTAALLDDLTPAKAADLLADLRVEEESPVVEPTGAFGSWVDADGDGCDTRSEVLRATSLKPANVHPGCVVYGRWRSVWDGNLADYTFSLVVDHAVPLGEAWRSGAHEWTAQDRADFHNDLEIDDALLPVIWRTSEARGTQDPSTWMPPVEAARCGYAIDWVTVKWSWDLSVDPEELAALAAALDDCAPRLLYKTSYSGTLYELVTNADGSQSRVPVTFARWRDVYDFAPYVLLDMQVVRYPWSSTLYAFTTWPDAEADPEVLALTFAQWQYAGFPAPTTSGWIAGSALHRYATGTQIFLVGPTGGVPHLLSYAEWQATGFQPFEQLANEGFVKLSWDSGIFHMTDLANSEGIRMTYSTWQQMGFPKPRVSMRLPGDSVFRYFGQWGIYYSSPVMYRHLSIEQWRLMGSPVDEVEGTPPIPPDRNCPDYPNRVAAQREFDLWRHEGYGDLFRLDADNDNIACEDYFGRI